MDHKTTKWLYLLFLVVIFTCGCDFNSKDQKEKKGKKDGPVKILRSDGTVQSIVNFKDGKRHGMAQTFYKNGKLRQQIDYFNNVKHGQVITYYESGAKFQVTPYVNGKIEGVREKYRPNGKLMAEVPFKNGKPCAGLKEYLINGAPKTQYPQIVIKEINNLLRSNEFILRISISDNSKKVVYYVGDMDPSGCISEEAMRIEPQQRGILELKYNLGPGMFMMEEMNIIAVVETPLRNPYIIQRKYNLAIENRQ